MESGININNNKTVTISIGNHFYIDGTGHLENF